MTDKLSVSVIQDDITWQDPADNRRRYQEWFDGLGDTDLIVLPEFFSTGFYPDPNDGYETMDGETVAWMRQAARDMNAVVTGSLVMRVGDDFVNRMIWARPDGEPDWYDKRHLFRFGGEHHNFTGGDQRTVFEHKGWRVALFICYDVRFPVWSRNRDDYDVALYVANWPDARQYAWDTLVRARAIENQAYVIAVNRLGADELGNTFSGGTAILDFKGMPIHDCDHHRESATEPLCMDQLNEFREHFPAALDQDDFEIKL